MMKIIIDTHIFLWILSSPEKINNQRTEILKLISNTIYVSSISIAELMIKASLNKIEINFNPIEMVEESGFDILYFTGKDAMLLKDMPYHHKDPFDRMLIAQSLSNDYPIMTDDHKFKFYDCKLI